MKFKVNIRNISIKKILILAFIISLLISVLSIGSVVFSQWISSSERMAENISEDINENKYDQILNFISLAKQMNEVNHSIIENEILDITNEDLRNKFFVHALKSYSKDIYSFSYGTENGEYYGARRNAQGDIEIMKNDSTTDGNSWYYSVNPNYTAGELVGKFGKFDPRTREWYKVAQAIGGPSFSPVYKHFVMDDLTVSASWPIYGNDGNLKGVMGSHMILTKIGSFLEDITDEYDGYAFIIEKESGQLIANSMNLDNFIMTEDSTIMRNTITDIDIPDIQNIFKEYNQSFENEFIFDGENEDLFVNFREINEDGLNWIILTVIPEGLYMSEVFGSVQLALIAVIVLLLILSIIYNIFSNKLTKPIDTLLNTSDALADGDLSQRVKIFRNDEIGKISNSFNNVAEKLENIVNNLEDTVDLRTKELNESNRNLETNKDELRLILDSTAEAIYGLNNKGECTFCNNSCVKILGYNSKEDLLGKNMHTQIHHTKKNGTPFALDDCKIYLSIKNGKGVEVDNEVFWKVDGTPFDVEYHSFPQFKNGKIVGGVVTFMDITNRKKKEEQIKYLSYHDPLSNLHNRRWFEENIKKIERSENLPLAIIFADINGLKLTNDIFGHAAGDRLIKKSSEILKNSCREKDFIARIGGDEFLIIMPNSSNSDVQNVLTKIKDGLSNEKVEAVKCSIALGYEIKENPEQPINEVVANAENSMYKDKIMNKAAINADIINTMLATLHSKASKEKMHSEAVSEMCYKMGELLNLSEQEKNKLQRAGFLHDIGKIALDEKMLDKPELLEDESEEMKQHAILGYRILNLFDDTLDLAEHVYSHHERWDGKGYPSGLKGTQIGLIARIISIAETYDRGLNRGSEPLIKRKERALKVIKDGIGTRFDPELATLFIKIIQT